MPEWQCLISVWFPASLILQAPYSVFEGDELVLRCQKRGREKLAVVKYTWNRKIISGTDESFDLLIPKASLNNSGCYQCIAFLENAYVLRTSQTNIQIQGKPFISYTFPYQCQGGINWAPEWGSIWVVFLFVYWLVLMCLMAFGIFLVPWSGLKQGSRQWKHTVLTTRPPGNSLYKSIP